MDKITMTKRPLGSDYVIPFQLTRPDPSVCEVKHREEEICMSGFHP